MDYIQMLQTYEQKLSEQQWEAVADFIDENAVFIFSEGTYRGKSEIADAFRRTFETIQDEEYRLTDIEWILVTDHAAACIYAFHWKGFVKGERVSGGGRGTTLLHNTGDGWKIVHEHLGPHQRQTQQHD